MKQISRVTLIILSLLPYTAMAALGDGKLTENKQSLSTFLKSIQGWLLGLVGGLGFLFIVYGGFLYMTSGGNKEKVETAKKTLTYAILGVVLVAMAGVILSVINGDFLTFIFGDKSL